LSLRQQQESSKTGTGKKAPKENVIYLLLKFLKR